MGKTKWYGDKKFGKVSQLSQESSKHTTASKSMVVADGSRVLELGPKLWLGKRKEVPRFTKNYRGTLSCVGGSNLPDILHEGNIAIKRLVRTGNIFNNHSFMGPLL